MTGLWEIWLFLAIGYLATVTIEIPVLILCMSPEIANRQKVELGLLLTAFSYPVVILVLPLVLSACHIGKPTHQIAIIECYAALAEVALFRFCMHQKLLSRPDRNAAAVVLANVCSFTIGALFLSDWIVDAIKTLLNY